MLTQAVCDELEYLWGDLDDAINYALNGRWSIRCDGLEDRIKTLTQLVGPTPWEKIPLLLLENGVYQRIHDDLGIRVVVDTDRVAEVRSRMAT
jgi:hypothetical protein